MSIYILVEDFLEKRRIMAENIIYISISFMKK